MYNGAYAHKIDMLILTLHANSLQQNVFSPFLSTFSKEHFFLLLESLPFIFSPFFFDVRV